ncbi:MAG TPA: rhodanese-like domain-containing protein [Terriglobia bacterium]|nr:rhodanese-like domain-containing protein [Terriglobia bacterium]
MNRPQFLNRRLGLIPMMLALAGMLFMGSKGAAGQALPDPWTPAQVMTPEDLLQALSKPTKPVVIAVTFRQLYDRGHVPGALYFGPGQNPVTIAALKEWAANQPKDEEIVIYCGCCPWPDCPNIKPPFALLKDLGFTRLRVVKIDTDFRRAWIEKKYPVEGSK